MAAKETDTTFQSTRALLDETITELVECLHSKREELSSFIDLVETEYKEKQIEIESDLTQLYNLNKQTESLAKNSLSELQQKLFEDISLKIDNLHLEAKQVPQLTLNFDKDSAMAVIDTMDIVGYELGALEFECDEDTLKVSDGKDKKGRKQQGRGRGRGRKGKGDTETGDTEEASDKKKKKNKQVKIEKKQSLEGDLVEDSGKANEARRDKKEEKTKKGKEDRKGSMGEPAPTQGKKVKNKGKGGFDAHSLLESAELTESL